MHDKLVTIGAHLIAPVLSTSNHGGPWGGNSYLDMLLHMTYAQKLGLPCIAMNTTLFAARCHGLIVQEH